MTMTDNPVIVSQKLVNSLLARPDFYSRMPEFGHMKSRIDMAKIKPARCRNCHQSRAEYDIMVAFSQSLLALPPDRLQALKSYAGITRLQYQGFNSKTGKYEVRII